MRKILASLIVLASSLLVWSSFRGSEAVPPCTQPIQYSIGSFDRRFDLSQAEFLQALAEAESIWEKPLGKELFAYSPERGELKINLVYDYRQAVTEKLSGIEDEVTQDESTYKALERKFDALKSQYEERKSYYESQVGQFNLANAAYERSVERWNRGPRTSKAEFENIEAERQSLERDAAALESLEAELKKMVSEVNSMVGRLNSLALSLNLNVKQFNTVGASRGETFAGGIYTSEANGKRIDIFEFSTREKLVRVLAHELGHALGLEHIDDREAIMYRLNEGEAERLAQSDLKELESLCAGARSKK